MTADCRTALRPWPESGGAFIIQLCARGGMSAITVRSSCLGVAALVGALAGLPAMAYTNTIVIKVNPERLWQCGSQWDPARTGHWSGDLAQLYLNGQLVRQIDLKRDEECNKVTTVSIEAGPNQEIVMRRVVQGGGEYVTKAVTVAADRVLEYRFFSDHGDFRVVSTDWDGAAGKPQSAAAAHHRGYELYFDGKLVSGPDAKDYTEQQARENCRWNMQTKPNLSIGCFFNGSRLSLSAASHSPSGASASAPQAGGQVNLALGKPATATGSYGSYGPERGNDGDPATVWNGGGSQACWTVDLQNVYAVQRVEVSSNQFGDAGRQTVFQVRASQDRSQWWPLGSETTAAGSQTFALSAAGRPLRFLAYCTASQSTQWATLGELKALGSPVPIR